MVMKATAGNDPLILLLIFQFHFATRNTRLSGFYHSLVDPTEAIEIPRNHINTAVCKQNIMEKCKFSLCRPRNNGTSTCRPDLSFTSKNLQRGLAEQAIFTAERVIKRRRDDYLKSLGSWEKNASRIPLSGRRTTTNIAAYNSTLGRIERVLRLLYIKDKQK